MDYLLSPSLPVRSPCYPSTEMVSWGGSVILFWEDPSSMSGKKSLQRRRCNEKLKIVVLSRLSSAPTLVKHSSSPVSPLYSPTSCWSPQGIRVFIKLTGQGGRGRSREGSKFQRCSSFICSCHVYCQRQTRLGLAPCFLGR